MITEDNFIIETIKEKCIIVNFREYENGGIFIVFMIKGQGFLKGILKAEQRRLTGEIRHFYDAQISYTRSDNDDETLAISDLKMMNKAEQSPPAF